jgi:hypothetical protein
MKYASLRRSGAGLAALALFAGAATGALAAETQKLSIIANGETVGTLTATVEGDHVGVDYRVDDNGRGPNTTRTSSWGPAAFRCPGPSTGPR